MIDKQTTIGAITLNVENLEQQINFYHQVIGLQILAQDSTMATLGTTNCPLIYLHHLPNGRFEQHTTGLYHLALRVPSRVALANWLYHYVKLNAPNWQGASDHGVSEALYLADPEGNGIEIYRDRPKTKWQVTTEGTISLYVHHLDIQALLHDANGNFDGISTETDMGHIHLKVADLTIARQFYVELLGFDLKMELPDSALFVAAGDYHHHIGINIWQSRHAVSKPTDTYGLAQFELQFSHVTARQTVIEQLQQAGVFVDLDADTPTVYDPFNHKICLDIQ